MSTTKLITCSRNQRNIFLTAIATSVITGWIYSLVLSYESHNGVFSRPPAHQNVEINSFQTKFIQNQVIHQMANSDLSFDLKSKKSQEKKHGSEEALSLIAKYDSLNTPNKYRYSVNDFSFFWKMGEGSPLFIDPKKHSQHEFKPLLFCTVPKVGCSSWKRVLKRIKGSLIYLADDHWSLHDPIENELDEDRIHKFGVNGANKLLYEKDIYHAIFVRDPVTRSLSAFLDKCINSGWTGKHWCEPTTVKHRVTRKTILAESQFDLFIENIINKPILRNDSETIDPPHFVVWAIDFHWLPQNFICDTYKFIDRYHVYRAENISHRKQFLLDIGGEKLWNDVGSYGWLTRNRDPTLDMTTVTIHVNKNKTKQVPSQDYFKGVHEYYNLITKDWRKNWPEINNVYSISDVNVSLLETATFHAQNAQTKIFKYFRSDILAKAIAYYQDDYVLFKLNIPYICDYLKYDKLSKLIDSVVKYYQNNQKDKKLEQSFIEESRNIYHGYYSIYSPKSKFRGEKVITTCKDENQSVPLIWNRDKWTKETNKDTKIPFFYDMKDFDDEYKEQLFEISFSGIRGMMTLINILSFIDPKTWPENQSCFNLQSNKRDLDITTRLEIQHIIELLHKYFNQLLPEFLKLDGVNEKVILQKFKQWTQTTDLSKLNIPQLVIQWIEQDKQMYINIRGWVLYQRDVPRNMFYAHHHLGGIFK